MFLKKFMKYKPQCQKELLYWYVNQSVFFSSHWSPKETRGSILIYILALFARFGLIQIIRLKEDPSWKVYQVHQMCHLIDLVSFTSCWKKWQTLLADGEFAKTYCIVLVDFETVFLQSKKEVREQKSEWAWPWSLLDWSQ